MLEMTKRIQYFGQEKSWDEIMVTFRNKGNSSKEGLRYRVKWIKLAQNRVQVLATLTR
jgi:hypothetical protein